MLSTKATSSWSAFVRRCVVIVTLSRNTFADDHEPTQLPAHARNHPVNTGEPDAEPGADLVDFILECLPWFAHLHSVMPVVNRRETTQLAKRALGREERHTMSAVVLEARKHTAKAMQKLVDLMDGKGGKVWVLDKEGDLVQIDIEVPAAVQAACAKLLIERGYGATPQALLIAEDTPENRKRLGIHERIAAIQAQRHGASTTTDLEASEITEIETSQPGSEIVPVAAQRAEEFLKRTDPVLSPADLI